MTFVYLLLFSWQAPLALNTYDTLEMCEAAMVASFKELKRIKDYEPENRYYCIPKPA